MSETKWREQDGFKFEIEWSYDEDAELDFMGSFSRNRPNEDWYVDRQDGLLYGPEIIQEETEDEDEVREGYPVSGELRYGDHNRFWIPEEHKMLNDKNWDHVPEATREAVIAKHGSLRQADIQHMIDDYEYYVRAMSGDEYAEWLKVTIYLDGEELDYETLGGIWSADEDYRTEVEQELIDGLLMNKAKYLEQINQRIKELEKTRDTLANNLSTD